MNNISIILAIKVILAFTFFLPTNIDIKRFLHNFPQNCIYIQINASNSFAFALENNIFQGIMFESHDINRIFNILLDQKISFFHRHFSFINKSVCIMKLNRLVRVIIYVLHVSKVSLFFFNLCRLTDRTRNLLNVEHDLTIVRNIVVHRNVVGAKVKNILHAK